MMLELRVYQLWPAGPVILATRLQDGKFDSYDTAS